MGSRNREMKTDREAMPPLEVTCISSICAYRMLLHWMVLCSTRGPAIAISVPMPPLELTCIAVCVDPSGKASDIV
jgi:hypothetical protein